MPDIARALAPCEGDDMTALDPVRVAQIRERVLSGAYDSLNVVDAMARRLLDSGELWFETESMTAAQPANSLRLVVVR
jgi:hypothetical protein